jgi:hypothetical protein
VNAVQKHYGQAPSQNRARTRRILIGARHLKWPSTREVGFREEQRATGVMPHR